MISQPDAARHRPEQREQAPTSIEQLIASWPATPAFVQGRYMDVLAANAMASAVAPTVLARGVNLVRATFLDPEVHSLRGDWAALARGIVARLRGMVGTDLGDPHLAELVDELSASSEQFRQLWERHDVDVVTLPTHVVNHPLVGPIELLTETLAITATEGQFLIIYHAEPGSASEQALVRLAGMAAGEHLEHA